MPGDDFPLDIFYSEICVWLTNRRKLSSDWIKHLKVLQKRSENAFRELPFAFAAQFPRTESGLVEFLTAQSIRDQLSESSERGYFGGLSGAAAVWDKIVRSYEKGNLHLGEAGQRLIQNVDFEIPFLKKQMESLDKKALELTRLKTEYENHAVLSEVAFRNECQELGIEGSDLQSEVNGLSDRIYEIIENGMQKLSEMETVLQFYRSMNTHVHKTGETALAVLESVLQGTVQRPDPELMKEQKKETESQVDPTPAPMEVKEEAVEESLEINWDLPEIESVEEVEWTAEVDDGIDWDVDIANIETEESSTAELTNLTTSVNETQTQDHQNQTTVSLETIPASVLCFVWDKDFRNKLLDDVYELQSFLKIRSLADPNDAILLNFSDVLFKFDHSQIQSYISHSTEAITSLAGENTQKYLLLKTSNHYLEHFIEDLKKKSNKPKEWRKAVIQTEQERSTVQTELSQTAVKLGQVARQTKELKELVESGISPLFNNRQINIMVLYADVLRSVETANQAKDKSCRFSMTGFMILKNKGGIKVVSIIPGYDIGINGPSGIDFSPYTSSNQLPELPNVRLLDKAKSCLYDDVHVAAIGTKQHL